MAIIQQDTAEQESYDSLVIRLRANLLYYANPALAYRRPMCHTKANPSILDKVTVVVHDARG